MNRFLKTLFVILLVITVVEAGYYLFISKFSKPEQKSQEKNNLKVIRSENYRKSNANDVDIIFLSNYFQAYLKELNNYNPNSSVNFIADSLYEGIVSDIYLNEAAQKIHPPDPEYPVRTVVAIVDIINSENAGNTNDKIRIRIVGSEMPNVSIKDEAGKEMSLDELKGKRIKLNRLVDLPLRRGENIATKEAIVRTNFIVLD